MKEGGRAKLMRLGRGGGMGSSSGAIHSSNDDLLVVGSDRMEQTLFHLWESGDHEDVERHLLAKGGPAVWKEVIKHLRHELNHARGEVGMLRLHLQQQQQQQQQLQQLQPRDDVLEEVARLREAMRSMHMELQETRGSLRQSHLDLAHNRDFHEKEMRRLESERELEKSKRLLLEDNLRSLVRAWELKQQQSLFVIANDDDDE